MTVGERQGTVENISPSFTMSQGDGVLGQPPVPLYFVVNVLWKEPEDCGQ